MILFYMALSFLSLLPIQTVHGFETKIFKQKKTRSVYGKYLKGHVFMTTEQAEDPQHCLADCWNEGDRCQSFNFLVLYNMCELNDRSKENAPDDYIDREGVVYFTNPSFGKEKIPEMPRHTEQYASTEVPDPCASSPCQNGGNCVLDDKTGFRCDNCNDEYYGIMCEQRADPCLASPCENGGTCVSTANFTYTCNCKFPTKGTHCTSAFRNYKFVISGTSDVPMIRPSFGQNYRNFGFWFWFQTNESIAYLASFLPDKPTKDEVFSIWKKGSTFYVELWRGNIMNFSFPYTYPLNDNTWHFVFFTFQSGSVKFYLDGAPRQESQKAGASTFHLFPSGVLKLGLYKDSIGTEYYSNVSISVVDISANLFDYEDMRSGGFLHKCQPHKGVWHNNVWTAGFHLTQKINLCDRLTHGVPKYFATHRTPHWLEQSVSPPRDLAAFTLSFWLVSPLHPEDWPFLLACYGPNGAQCSFSVTIQVNMTLAIVVSSYRAVVDLIPILDYSPHHVVITWTNQGGVLEVIIDMVLQSRLINIGNGRIVPAQNRFLVGGSDVAEMNFLGHLGQLNLWDEILPTDILYQMALYPGEDCGNVVSWKKFYKPFTSVTVLDSSQHMSSRVYGSNYHLLFSSNAAGNFSTKRVCCTERQQITFATWFKLSDFPAVLFSYETTISDQEVYLSIGTQGNITWMLQDSEISVGNISTELGWHFIAVTWDMNGQLHSNLDGVHNIVSSSYKDGHVIHGEGYWYIGSKNRSLVGVVVQANVWDYVLPAPSLRALSRGANNINTKYPPRWNDFSLGKQGTAVKLIIGSKVYIPIYKAQMERDALCNTTMETECSQRYYARFGTDGNKGVRMGCFCESELTEDKNYNFGQGNFSQASELDALT